MRITAAAFSLLILFSSCASLFSKSSYPIKIDSNPDDLKFEVFNRDGFKVALGKTPQIVNLRSSAGYFQPESYSVVFYGSENEEVSRLPINFHADGWYIGGNLVWLWAMPITYLIIDPLTGAMWTPNQKYILANIDKSTSSVDVPILKVLTIDQFEGEKSSLIPVDNGE